MNAKTAAVMVTVDADSGLLSFWQIRRNNQIVTIIIILATCIVFYVSFIRTGIRSKYSLKRKERSVT